jgi:HEPN domain-containing protein
MTAMSDAERLRQRSKRLLELASRAYCEKHYDFARLLIQLAAEVLEHASEMDQSHEAQRAASVLPRLSNDQMREKETAP